MSEQAKEQWRESVTSDGTRYIERPMPNWKPGDFPMEEFTFEHLQVILADNAALRTQLSEIVPHVRRWVESLDYEEEAQDWLARYDVLSRDTGSEEKSQ